MSILEILEAHYLVLTGDSEAEPGEWKAECVGCDWEEAYSDASADLHMRHVAQVLEQHERGRCYEAWREGVAVYDPDAVDIMEAVNPYKESE